MTDGDLMTAAALRKRFRDDSAAAARTARAAADALFADECLESRVLLAVALVPAVLAGAGRYPTGEYPIAIVAADFNGDRKPDIAVANQNSNTIGIFRNKGRGTFARQVLYRVGKMPDSIVAADFNGDRKIDLAVTNFESGTVSILRNKGNGTFVSAGQYDTGQGCHWLTAADFNADHKPDLAVVNSAKELRILLNNGKGRFLAAGEYDTGDQPWSVTSADLNGDHFADIAVANEFNNNIGIFISRGNGTFETMDTYPSGVYPLPVVAADFDADGDMELAAGCTGTAGDNSDVAISVLDNNGLGAFPTRVDYSTGLWPWWVTPVDINLDGKIDLAAIERDSDGGLYVLLNKGDGTFADATRYEAGAWSCSIAAADFNGDRKVDIAVTNSTGGMHVLLNRTPPYTPPKVTIKPVATRVDPGSTSDVNFTVAFSERVTDFGPEDLVFGGTAQPTAVQISGGPAKYNVAVTGMQSSGTVTLSIQAGGVLDAAGHGNRAATATSEVLYDQAPEIHLLWSEPGTIHRGEDFSILAVADDPDPGDVVTRVDFYATRVIRRRERKVLIGTGTQNGNGWTWQGSSNVLSRGWSSYYAYAYDSHGLFSVQGELLQVI